MTLDKTIRETHRWISLAFTAGVVVNIVAFARAGDGEAPAPWIGMLALLPLIVLLLTGLYLFVLPYFAKGRRGS